MGSAVSIRLPKSAASISPSLRRKKKCSHVSCGEAGEHAERQPWMSIGTGVLCDSGLPAICETQRWQAPECELVAGVRPTSVNARLRSGEFFERTLADAVAQAVLCPST